MSRFPRLAVLFVALLILAGCDDNGGMWVTHTPDAPPTATAWITNTPTAAVTPTPEGPGWSTDCLPDGVVALNTEEASPCPINYEVTSYDGVATQEIPAGMVLVVKPNTPDSIVPSIRYVDNAMRLYVYRVDGRVGVQIHGLELTANHCYTLNVPMRINLLGSSSFENFSAYSRIHTDRDTQFDRGTHRLVEISGFNAKLVNDLPNVFFSFQPSRDMTIVWEVGYEATWATAGGGNHVDFLAFYVQDQDDTGNCD